MTSIFALLAGLLFGAGLMVSGMANPAKVQGFLDLAGHWDPSLAFVMVGAIAVGVIAFQMVKNRQRSYLGLPLQLPAATAVTLRLAIGSAAFGIGWGLAGFCPGPGVVAMAAGEVKALVFVAAMLAGMFGFQLLDRSGRRTPHADEELAGRPRA